MKIDSSESFEFMTGGIKIEFWSVCGAALGSPWRALGHVGKLHGLFWRRLQFGFRLICVSYYIGRPLVRFEDVLRVLGVLSQRFKLLLLCLDDDTIGYAIFVAIG